MHLNGVGSCSQHIYILNQEPPTPICSPRVQKLTGALLCPDVPPRVSTLLQNPLSAGFAGRMWAGEKGRGGAEGVQLGGLVLSMGYDHKRGVAGGWEGEGSARGAALAWGSLKY